MKQRVVVFVPLLFVLFSVAACSSRGSVSSTPTEKLSLDAPLPTGIPPGTKLVIGDPVTQRVLEHTQWNKSIPFEIEWAHIQGGPAVTEAFSARALDVGSSANMPPIHASWVGIPVKIIAVRLHKDPDSHPLYVLGISPQAKIDTLKDLRGKKIAFSPGQIQGEVVLRTLMTQGLTLQDVELVELPSTGDVYVNALGDHTIDVAPLAAGAVSKRYIDTFGKIGGKLRPHTPFRDDLTVLYVRSETLEDPAKAAALRAYVKLWIRAAEWEEQNPEGWARIYWMQTEGLSADDARHQVEAYGPRYTPRDWSEAIALEQGSIDLFAQVLSRKHFDATTLFDRRFEKAAFEP